MRLYFKNQSEYDDWYSWERMWYRYPVVIDGDLAKLEINIEDCKTAEEAMQAFCDAFKGMSKETDLIIDEMMDHCQRGILAHEERGRYWEIADYEDGSWYIFIRYRKE